MLRVVSAEVSIYNADPFVSNDDRVHGFAESIRITPAGTAVGDGSCN